MARPREGEELKRTIRQRGDKFYAYEITSVMENGKKKTVSKYLGRVDPESGKLLEKIPEKSAENRRKIAEERTIQTLKDIRVADYGGVYLLDGIQRKIKLGEDLNTSFGITSETMLTLAFALVQCGGVFSAVEGTLMKTWSKELYGTAGVYDSGTLSKFTHEIGVKAQANIEKFFECRIKRNKGLLAWDTTTIGCHSDMDGMAEFVKSNKDHEDLKQVKVGFATDMRGVPLMYRQYSGNVSDMDTVKLLAKEIIQYGGAEALFVLDRGFCSGWNVRFLLKSGIKFVMPATTSSQAVKKLFTEFNSVKEIETKEHNKRMYKVWKTELGINKAEGRTKADGDQAYMFTNSGTVDFDSEGKVVAYVCYDTKKYSDEMQSHLAMINSLLEAAEKIDAADPVAAFKKKAGKAIRHFNVTANGRKVVVSVKKNSASFEENRAGIFVMLASEDVDWKTVMIAYDARRLTEQGFDRKKGENGRFNTSDKETMKGREFLRFLDLTLRCEISAEIRECDLIQPPTAEEAIAILNCIQVREYKGTRFVTEVDKKQRTLLKLFDLQIPKEALADVAVFDPPE